MSYADDVIAARRVALATFGEPVTYTPLVGTPVTPTGIFGDQYVLASGSAQAGVSTSNPAVFLLLEDLPTDPREDKPTLTVRGVVYRVHEKLPDGMGGIVLALRKVT